MLAVDKLKRVSAALLRHSTSPRHYVTSSPHVKDTQGHNGGGTLKASRRRTSLIDSYPSSGVNYPSTSCLVPINVCQSNVLPAVTSQSHDDVIVTPTNERRVTSFEQRVNTSTTTMPRWWNYFDAADAYESGTAVNVNGVCFSVYGTLPRNLVRRRHARQAQGQDQGHSEVQGHELWCQGRRLPAPSPPRRTNSVKTTTGVQQRPSDSNDLEMSLNRRRPGLTAAGPSDNRTSGDKIIRKQTMRCINTADAKQRASDNNDLDSTLTRRRPGSTRAELHDGRTKDDNIVRGQTMRSINTADLQQRASDNNDLDSTLTRRRHTPGTARELNDRQTCSSEDVLCWASDERMCGWSSDDDDVVPIATRTTDRKQNTNGCLSRYPATGDSHEHSAPPPYNYDDDDTIKRRITATSTASVTDDSTARDRRDDCRVTVHRGVKAIDSVAASGPMPSYRDDNDDTIKCLTTGNSVASNGRKREICTAPFGRDFSGAGGRFTLGKQRDKMPPPSSSQTDSFASNGRESPDRQRDRCAAGEHRSTVSAGPVTAAARHERSDTGGENAEKTTDLVDDRLESGTVKTRRGRRCGQKSAAVSSRQTTEQHLMGLSADAGAVSSGEVMQGRLDGQEFDVDVGTQRVIRVAGDPLTRRPLLGAKHTLPLTDDAAPAVVSSCNDVVGLDGQEFDVDLGTVVRRRQKSSSDVTRRFTNSLTTDAHLWSVFVLTFCIRRLFLRRRVCSLYTVYSTA